MAGHAADNDLADKFVALVTEETESFSGLIAVLVQRLVTVVGDTGVWARVVFHCTERTKTHTHTSGISRSLLNARPPVSVVDERHSQTHFGPRSLHLGVPVSRPWQEIWLGPSSW